MLQLQAKTFHPAPHTDTTDQQQKTVGLSHTGKYLMTVNQKYCLILPSLPGY